MAIDTLAKRASIHGLVIPDGTIDQADRQTITGVYGGILAGEAAAVAAVLQACIAFSEGTVAAIAFSEGDVAAIAFSEGDVAAIAFSATNCD